MAEQYRANVGHEPELDARRDAIHVAVAPIIAGMPLDPGDHVWIGDNSGAAYKEQGQETSRTIGVVDPFYNGVVVKGQRFWLFLYPNTITDLRHVWSHPAFKAHAPMETKNV
jgi:hypothetical protein